MRQRTADGFASSARNAFEAARRSELWYATRLRSVARTIGDIVNGLFAGAPEDAPRIAAALTRYETLIAPWAEKVGDRMVKEVAARDAKAWWTAAEEMGRNLKREINAAPTGIVMQAAQARQVALITSLPREAATRVQTLSREGLARGMRADELAAEILRSGDVSKARANTIARTEVSRAATELTKARAESIGSPGYTWRTARDGRVRPSHREMQGKFVAWDAPPTLDGMTGHAGCFPNCRCNPAPILPD